MDSRMKVIDWGIRGLVGVAILLSLNRLHESRQPQAAVDARLVPNWTAFTREGHRVGASSPSVTIVAFLDYQCVACGTAQAGVDRILRDHPHEVAVVYRHLPSPNVHRHSLVAAKAVECAASQGRFEALHSAMLQEQSQIGVRSWNDWVGTIGLKDATAFQVCMDSQYNSERIREDLDAAHLLGIPATPSFLINNRLVVGYPGYDKLYALIVAELDTPYEKEAR
jgi:protein-disulfide isomerase